LWRFDRGGLGDWFVLLVVEYLSIFVRIGGIWKVIQRSAGFAGVRSGNSNSADGLADVLAIFSEADGVFIFELLALGAQEATELAIEAVGRVRAFFGRGFGHGEVPLVKQVRNYTVVHNMTPSEAVVKKMLPEFPAEDGRAMQQMICG